MSKTEADYDGLEWALIDGCWCMAETGEDVAMVMLCEPPMTVEFWLDWFRPDGDKMLYYEPQWYVVPLNRG